MHYGVKSEMPIYEAIKDMKDKHVDMFMYYGESDWMDYPKTQKIIRENNLNITLELITKSDH